MVGVAAAAAAAVAVPESRPLKCRPKRRSGLCAAFGGVLFLLLGCRLLSYRGPPPQHADIRNEGRAAE